uniref:Uncharacterized protein n=1 Tax=Anguilla anguilla TaxID=7936 RepID=A0A0E9TXH6_ANGAN
MADFCWTCQLQMNRREAADSSKLSSFFNIAFHLLFCWGKLNLA